MAFTRWVLVFILLCIAFTFSQKNTFAEWTFDADPPSGTVTLRCSADNRSQSYTTNSTQAFSCSGNITIQFDCTDTHSGCAAVLYTVDNTTTYCKYAPDNISDPTHYGCQQAGSASSPRSSADGFGAASTHTLTAGNHSISNIYFLDVTGNKNPVNGFTVTTAGGSPACPGGTNACGDSSYGRLGTCTGGTWAYNNNSQQNTWCSQNTGGQDPYCYTCNVNTNISCNANCTVVNGGPATPSSCTGNTYFYVQKEGYPAGQCATACLSCGSNQRTADGCSCQQGTPCAPNSTRTLCQPTKCTPGQPM